MDGSVYWLLIPCWDGYHNLSVLEDVTKCDRRWIIFSFIKKLLKKLIKLLKKIWDKIRPYLAVIALVFAVFAPMLAPWLATLALPSYLSWAPTLAAGLAEIGWPLSAALGLGVAAVIDSDATKDVIDKVGGAIGDVGHAVGGAVGDTLSGFLSQPSVLLIGGLVLAYFLLSRDKDRPESERVGALDDDSNRADTTVPTKGSVATPSSAKANGTLAGNLALTKGA